MPDRRYILATTPLPRFVSFLHHPPRRRTIAASLAVLLALIVATAFGPVVRGAARSWGTRHGASVEARGAWPAWGGVRLTGVHVEAPDFGLSEARFDEVVVRVGLTFAPRKVEVRGGTVSLTGAPDELLRKFRRRKEGNAPADAADGQKAGLDFAVSGVDIRWEGALDEADVATIRGLRVERAAGSGKLGVSRIEWTGAHASIAAREIAGSFARRTGRTELDQLSLQGLDLDIQATEPPADHPPSAGPTAGSSPGAHPGPGAPSAHEPADPEHDREEAGLTAPGEGFAWLRKIGSLRGRLLAAVARSADLLAEGGLISVDEVRFSLHRGRAQLNAGPGLLRVRHDGDSLTLDVQAGGGAERASSSLNIRARAPISADFADPIAIEIEGGPVTLAALGVHENDFGLLEVDKATVDARAKLQLPHDGASVLFDGTGRLASLSLDDRRLADEPVRGLELAWRAKGSGALDGSRLAVDEGELALGATRIRAHGVLESAAGAARLEAQVAVPAVECQKMLDSIPHGLIPKLVGLRIGGVFSFDGHIAIDTRKPEEADLDWHLANRCRVVSTPAEVDVARFSQPFRHVVYDPDGQKVELMAGPGTPDWVPLGQMSRYLEAAVTTTEDGGFWHHGGFDKGAIRNSIRDDLKAGKFLRGASTISMQLAKNLYLEREKNLSRKLQEAFLTMYLEQELSKDEILELYFNVVEFGPMIYGIGPAADYYFHTVPSDLSLGQSLFLVSILPSPKRQYFGADGHLSKGYTNYLHRLMQIMYDHKRIDDRELAEGLSEVLVLGSPHPYHVDAGGASDATLPARARELRSISPDGP